MTMTMTTSEIAKSRSPQEAARAGDCKTAVLDLAHLRRFTAGNIALEREVLQMFADQTPLTLRSLQLARTDKDWRDAAHTLKGSAFAVGANLLARTAAEAEVLRAEPQRWPQMLLRLDLAVAEVRAEVRRVLAAGV